MSKTETNRVKSGEIELQEKVVVSIWERYDENQTVIRLATCWATQKEDVVKLLKIM